MTPPFSHQHRVRFRECDPQGIAFNGSCVGCVDDAFTDWVREGLPPGLDGGD